MTLPNISTDTRKEPCKKITNTINFQNHFAEGVNLNKLFWIFTLGSFFGFIVETAWCILKNGSLESRTSLIYMPFNAVYGVGAFVLYLSLYKVDKEDYKKIFLYGVFFGTVTEYICSWAQEMLFGTVSWDYSGVIFNIGGRVCLLYSAFWGILAILWVKVLLPNFEKLINKIPNAVGKGLTKYLFVLIMIMTIISVMAVSRWTMRVDGIGANGISGELIDYLFPDSLMKQVYPNMQFGR